MNEYNKYVNQIFTPEWLVKEVLDKSSYINDLEDKKILEPAAGIGNFVLEIIRRLTSWLRKINYSNEEILNKIISNIYAYEIDSDNFNNLIKNIISLVNELLEIKITRNELINIKSSDSLRMDEGIYFDFIITNPPYTPVKFLPKKSRIYIEENFSFNIDIYETFYEKFIRCLKKNGILSFITPTKMKENIKLIDLIKPVTYDIEEYAFTANIMTTIYLVRREDEIKK